MTAAPETRTPGDRSTEAPLRTGPRPRPRARIAADQAVDVTMTVNGTEATVSVPARMHLADALRERLGLTGTHLGCEHGVCGMCTVLLDGEAVRACLLFAVQCEGAEIVTVEGLGGPDDQHPLQRAFSAHHALQCGFCTPGMLISGYDLLVNGPDGTCVPRARLPEEMSGVLCRCTGYRGILAAVADVAATHPDGLPGPLGLGERTLVGRAAGGVSPSASTAHAPAAEHPPADGAAAAAEVRPPTGTPSARVRVRHEVAAPAEKVWAVLDDFDQLARCLPGAELVEVLDADRYRGRATVALGPVRLSFAGLAQVVERDPDEYRMRVLAQGRDTGGSATQADIRLRVEPVHGGGVVLHADAALFMSGRIAQFGRALAGDVSRRLFDQFGACVEQTARTGRAVGRPAKPPSAMRLLLATVSGRLRALVRRARSRRRG